MSTEVNAFGHTIKLTYLLVLFVLLDVALAGQANGQDTFYFTSSQSSWVGGGLTETITPQQGYTFTEQNNGNDLDFSITDFPAGEWWYLDFIGPNSTRVTPGLYANATRYPFQGSGPGLSFVGDGRGDNQLTGYFNVLQATYNTSGQLQSFAADFVQYDEGNLSAWNDGSIRFNSTIPIPEPSTLALAGCGMIGLGARACRRHRHA